jgi:Raf kinase inhibitor-like YbhB/YbcL family protein
MAFTLRCEAFEDGKDIPSEYTCEGANVSPELTWSGAPGGTRSFALVVDDPDAPDPQAPRVRWVHWVLYNLPAELMRLPKGIDTLPPGTLQGSTIGSVPGGVAPAPRLAATVTSSPCTRSARCLAT